MSVVLVYIILNALLAFLTCFYGKKLYYIVSSLTIAGTVAYIIIQNSGVNTKNIIIIAVVFILTMLLFRFFYKAAVFIMMALAGAGIGTLISMCIHEGNMFYNYKWIIIVGLSLVLGIIGVIWADLFIIVSTAYNGAVSMSQIIIFISTQLGNLKVFYEGMEAADIYNGLDSFIKNDITNNYNLYLIIGTIILTIVGFIYQKKRN